MIQINNITLVKDEQKVATIQEKHEVTSFRALNKLRVELEDKYGTKIDFNHTYDLNKSDHRITRFILDCLEKYKNEKKDNSPVS